ncbi:ankyrin [Rhizopus microsporus ATCC 52813]|uniref:Ankyrin n=1 Tax=Rhizopus microsporus ATCC 52813 TaxID=1340429 RepID=A0A2G4T393_RHIZD|nr:ankyrin [Rhizopus microsporus ATCC 52813]PHZ15490.1 ankyrin [Rhizopus microsporus ATCC 52813]
MANSQQVFQATYSGVPVYEMLCRGVAVMRRKSDSYLNATQILKVAGFDKPHRTRILEREVQTGQHEKVQGGYGKYQGTWVPLERGDKSPPIAPKHTTAASARAKKAAREPRPVRKRVRREMVEEDISDIDDMSHHGIHILPAPVEAAASPGRRTRHVKERRHNNKPAVVKEERPEVKEPAVEPAIIVDDPVIDDYDSREKTYAQKLLQFFMSGRQGIPSLLAYPSRDLDLNLIIDDEGHTSLHWASAMARIDIVKTLIDHGAEIDRVNYQGQTALMRSVLFTNNFDEKTFDTLLTFLRPTVFHIDKKDQTVFHHIATTAGSKGKVHASRYYMECLINKLSSNRSELISILNVQDAYGDTALTIAARIGNKRLIKLLIDAGASTEIANEDGMTSRDYINEMERRSAGEFSSLLPFQTNNDILLADANSHEALRQKVNTMFKQVISSLNNNDVVPPISEVFDSFAESYERDLISKENSVQKKRIELELYTKRLAETKRVLESIVFNAEDTIAYEETGKRGLLLESRLKKWLQFSQKETLLYLIKAAEDNPHSGNTGATSSSSTPPSELIELKKTAELLQQELAELQSSRKDKVRSLINILCQIPSKKYQDYKRLISTSCNIPYENVEMMLEPLLASFEEENLPEREMTGVSAS